MHVAAAMTAVKDPACAGFFFAWRASGPGGFHVSCPLFLGSAAKKPRCCGEM